MYFSHQSKWTGWIPSPNLIGLRNHIGLRKAAITSNTNSINVPSLRDLSTAEFHPLRRRGVRRTGWFLIPRWQTQSDGVHYVPPNSAPLFSLPRRGIGMGLIEMPHSFQRREVIQRLHRKLYNYNYLLNISKFTAKNIFKYNHSDEFFKLSKYSLFIELLVLITLG